MSYSPYHGTIYLDMLQAQMVSIRARRDKMKTLSFEFPQMYIEFRLLNAELTALEDEYRRIEEEMK